jgi:hypothetical protein
MRTTYALACCAISLSACLGQSTPGQQCLDSFKGGLKDPESGKVISFSSHAGLSDLSELIYTATNTFGGRVQSTAYCSFADGKWTFVEKAFADSRVQAELARLNVRPVTTALDKQLQELNHQAVAHTECSKDAKSRPSHCDRVR